MEIWQMPPFVITEEGNVKNFTEGKMESIFYVDERYLDFLQIR